VTPAVARLAVTAGTALLCTGGLQAQGSPLATLLAKAAAYELGFIEKFSNVVAEEVYVQETSAPRRKRTLKSDFLFVRYANALGWYVFRDVVDVDGKPVRDAAKSERLLKLFSDSPRDVLARANQIAEEGARYNIRDIGTLNNPMAAMVFLQPNYQKRFRFTLAGVEKSLGPTVRTVKFEEFQLPTILRANANSDLPARGLLWIDEPSGRVVKTRLQVGSSRIPPEIVTTFRYDETLGIDVPAEMRDWYPDGTGDIRGLATYGRFRRFQVKTDEVVETPSPK
jgi:hypothetical protein